MHRSHKERTPLKSIDRLQIYRALLLNIMGLVLIPHKKALQWNRSFHHWNNLSVSL